MILYREIRTELEERIISDLEIQESLQYSYPRRGRPDKNMRQHVEHILRYIDLIGFEDITNDLRILALLHDFGKFRTVYSKNGHIIGPSHAVISAKKAEQFITDPEMLEIILKHDKYFTFFREQRERMTFREEKFRAIFEGVDFRRLISFNYCDSCERERESIVWFEDKAYSLGMTKSKVYINKPCVLQTLTALL